MDGEWILGRLRATTIERQTRCPGRELAPRGAATGRAADRARSVPRLSLRALTSVALLGGCADPGPPPPAAPAAAIATAATNTPTASTVQSASLAVASTTPAEPPIATCPTLEKKSAAHDKIGDRNVNLIACDASDEAACVAECDRGNPTGCTAAGNLLAMKNREPERQVVLYTRACELGALLGCTNLGATLRMSNGTVWRANFACAADLFTRACDGDEPWGCAMLGFAYADGEGVATDAAAARRVMEKACNKKNATPADVAFACESYASMLESGKLGAPDAAASARAYAAACHAGSRHACGKTQGP
jgi:hypothetical protein